MMTMFNKVVHPFKVAATVVCFGVGMLWMMAERP